MKDIMLKIIGKQVTSDSEEEQLEFLNRKLMENAKNAFKMHQQNSDK